MADWYDIDTNAAVKTVRDLVFGRATGLSSEAVRVLLDRPLPIGEPVDVKLAIPPTQVRVVATAVVREVAERDGRYDTELVLRTVGDDARTAIDTLVAEASERSGRRRRTTRPMRAATPAPGPVAGKPPAPPKGAGPSQDARPSGGGGATVRRATGRGRAAEINRGQEAAGRAHHAQPSGLGSRAPGGHEAPPARPTNTPDRPVRTARDRRPSARMSAARRRLLQTDRRSEPRAPVTMPVTVSREGATEVTTTVDVSRGGMFLRVSLPTSYEKREPVRVELAGLDGLPLRLDARVANVVVKGARVGVGVQFVNASDDAALGFAALLRMVGL